MKWAAVLLCVVVFYAFGRSARRAPRHRVALAVAIGVLPFFDITLNPISYEAYRGDARGLEFSLVDFVALASLAAVPAGRGAIPPLAWRNAMYLLVCAASTFAAPNPLFAGFAVWKALRAALLFVAVHRLVSFDDRGPDVLRGLALGVVASGALALQQRYLLGHFVSTGPFSHQNGLAMAVNMVVPPCYALALAGRGGALAKAAVAAGAVAVVLTLSRGGLAMYAMALGIVYVGSLAKRASARKVVFLVASLGAAAAILLKSLDTIVERFLTAPDASHEARELFEEAARRMLRDHPGGIGLNQYSFVLDRTYADPLGNPDIDRDGIVHNIYWLTTAELGYAGIVTFGLLLVAPLLAALEGAWRERDSAVGDVLLGACGAFAVTLLHSTLEWALRITQVGFVFWVVGGLAVGLRDHRRMLLGA